MLSANTSITSSLVVSLSLINNLTIINARLLARQRAEMQPCRSPRRFYFFFLPGVLLHDKSMNENSIVSGVQWLIKWAEVILNGRKKTATFEATCLNVIYSIPFIYYLHSSCYVISIMVMTIVYSGSM
jgi:hypothetical protein